MIDPYQNAACPNSKSTFMVIDDKPDIAEAVGKIIQLTGHHALPYTNPIDAVSAFEKNPGEFAAVITDLRMPYMSGEQVMANVRQLAPDIPIIVITANESSLDPQSAKRLAITELIRKPFELRQILEIVDQYATNQSN